MADHALSPSAQPDADVTYLPEQFDADESAGLFAALRDETPWRQESVFVYGRRLQQPRLIAWYGDPGAVYAYSGLTLEPLAWTRPMQDIKARAEQLAQASFNSALLNYYRDGEDSMGWHADDEAELGGAPVIASVSFGATRTFRMKHKRRRDVDPVAVELESGSVLVMRPPTQAHWLHAVPKRRRVADGRINITFRHIVGRS